MEQYQLPGLVFHEFQQQLSTVSNDFLSDAIINANYDTALKNTIWVLFLFDFYNPSEKPVNGFSIS